VQLAGLGKLKKFIHLIGSLTCDFQLVAKRLKYYATAIIKKKLNTAWPESTSELYRPNDRNLSVKLVPTCLVSTNEELLGRNSSGYGLEIRECGSRDTSR
jgi:hypothetical protein